jgi:hypothetical protein
MMLLRELSRDELRKLADLVRQDVRNRCGDEAVDYFYRSNLDVAAQFVACSWVRVREYLHVQTVNALMMHAMLGGMLGFAVGFLLAWVGH